MKFKWKTWALFLFFVPWHVQGLSFKIQDIGTLSNFKAVAHDMNNHNRVVGHFVDYDGERYNFTWDVDNQFIPFPHKTCFYQPLSINNHDQIAAIFWHRTNYWLFENQQLKHVCLIEKNGSLTDLGAPSQWKMQVLHDWQTASAWEKDDLAIVDFNDCGQLVLTNSSERMKAKHFAIWEKGRFESIDPDKISIVYAINNQGLLLARHWVKKDKGNYPMLVLYDRKNQTMQEIVKDIDLEERQLNDRGQVLLNYSIRDGNNVTTRACLWDPQNGLTTWEGFVAIAMNNCDQVIGWQLSAERASIPMLWHKGEWIDLEKAIVNQGELLWREIHVSEINDQGYILGSGSFDGKDHPFILIPQK